ncbi:MAG: DUF1016 family protein [Prevotella sp.]|nr:DUF1016 family protein [Prevotella sp.]
MDNEVKFGFEDTPTRWAVCFNGENPPVGIILCKKAGRAYVDYVLQNYQKPMGVATYQQMQSRLRELLLPEEW